MSVNIKQEPVIKAFLAGIQPVQNRIKKLILFGSRARGDDKPYSDYDVLIVVDRRDQPLVDALYDAVMDVLFKTGKDISLKIYGIEKFEKHTSIPTPFMANILREGIVLG